MIPKHKRFLYVDEEWEETVWRCVFFDQERRQYMSMDIVPETVPKIPDNHVRRIESEKTFYEYAKKWLPDICDTLPPDRRSFRVDWDGKLFTSRNDAESMVDIHPCYLTAQELQLPEGPKVVNRGRLLELVRRPHQVDRVAYWDNSDGHVEADFFYYCTPYLIVDRIRNHYVLAQLDPNDRTLGRYRASVLEDGVMVGYLTHPSRGPNIYTFSSARKKRPFKLAHLKQLLEGIELLNLKYGLVSMNLEENDIVIDEDTDELWFRSFSHCLPITSMNAMYDVTLAYILLYEKITHKLQTPPTDLDEARALVNKLISINHWGTSDLAELDGDEGQYRDIMDDFFTNRLEKLFPDTYGDPDYTDPPLDVDQTNTGEEDEELVEDEDDSLGLRGGMAGPENGSSNQEHQPDQSRKRRNEEPTEDPRTPKRNRTDESGPDESSLVSVNWMEALVPGVTNQIDIPTTFSKVLENKRVDFESDEFWHRGETDGTRNNPVVKWYRPPTTSPARAKVKFLLANGEPAPADLHHLWVPQPPEEEEEPSDWDPFVLASENEPNLEGVLTDAGIRAIIEEATRAAGIAKEAARKAEEATRTAKAETKNAKEVVSQIEKATNPAEAAVKDYVEGNARVLRI
ncbi:hypothetical protein B0T21DRAFT_455253 [Apiosordaria backusii]|uniref:Uncharacterized protein n=1 Tax=Apiosordaria backusii TaxID=314023 RepID=A0AA40DN25_9PEZI|nr:hypothetical protein B0T21DRAFT_455253 [Apiosordaria backusii]